MRVLHVLTSLDPSHGGTVAAAQEMSAAMSQAGDRTEVLSLVAPQRNWLSNWRVNTHWLSRTFSYYCYAPELVPWLQKHRREYDAVVVHGVWRYASVGVWRALRNTSTPYFLFTHGMLDPWFRSAYPGKHVKKAIFWRLFENRVLRDARAVLFTSEDERYLVRTAFHPYRCREQVVTLGISAPPRGSSERDAFMARFPHLRGKRLVLCLSRIHRKKGCDVLIRAFSRIASLDRHLHLVLAGPDEEGWQAELERLTRRCGIGERVTFTGRLDGSLKWGAFYAAEVFALASHSENYGVAIVEAMACGLPVLITNKVNIWREIEKDGAGLVASDQVNDFTDLLKVWCSLNSEQVETFRSNAQLCFRNRFEIGSATKALLAYLNSELKTQKNQASSNSQIAFAR